MVGGRLSTFLAITKMQNKKHSEIQFTENHKDGLKWKTQTITSVDMDWQNWNTNTLLVRIQNCIVTWENSLTVPQNVKHTAAIWPSNSTRKYNTMRKENIHPHKILCTDIHSGIIYNRQKVEQSKFPSTDEWANKTCSCSPTPKAWESRVLLPWVPVREEETAVPA